MPYDAYIKLIVHVLLLLIFSFTPAEDKFQPQLFVRNIPSPQSVKRLFMVFLPDDLSPESIPFQMIIKFKHTSYRTTKGVEFNFFQWGEKREKRVRETERESWRETERERERENKEAHTSKDNKAMSFRLGEKF